MSPKLTAANAMFVGFADPERVSHLRSIEERLPMEEAVSLATVLKEVSAELSFHLDEASSATLNEAYGHLKQAEESVEQALDLINAAQVKIEEMVARLAA